MNIKRARLALISALISVDRDRRNGLFWLTGSQKFQLMQGLTESLAGGVAIVDLLGFSQAEQQHRALISEPFVPTPAWISKARGVAKPMPLKALFDQNWLGAYPRLVAQGPQNRDVFYRSYVQTYVQRDVQDLLKVSDPMSFHRFLSVVAARTGQLLNYAGRGAVPENARPDVVGQRDGHSLGVFVSRCFRKRGAK